MVSGSDLVGPGHSGHQNPILRTEADNNNADNEGNPHLPALHLEPWKRQPFLGRKFMILFMPCGLRHKDMIDTNPPVEVIW